MKIYLYKYINAYFASRQLPSSTVMEELEWLVVQYPDIQDLREFDTYGDDLDLGELLDAYAAEVGELIDCQLNK